jgi:hypothetical protein
MSVGLIAQFTRLVAGRWQMTIDHTPTTSLATAC